MPSLHHVTLPVLPLGVCVLLLAACGDGGSGAAAPSAPTVPSIAVAAADPSLNPYGEAPAQALSNTSSGVLTIVPAGAPPRELTIADLGALGSEQLTIDEPFVKQRQTFTGAPLALVLAAAGIPEQATIDTVGADDYTFGAPASQFLASGALVAYEVDGAPIAADRAGPIRLVYPDGSALAADPDAWTWRLVTIKQVDAGATATAADRERPTGTAAP